MSSRRSRRSGVWNALRLAASIPIALLCVGANSSWDSRLERDEFGEPGDWCVNQRKGWTAADGGLGARHTITNRSFMFFGDTFLSDSVGGVNAAQMVPNTMLELRTVPPVHAAPSESPWGTNIEFWARNSSSGAQRAGLTAASVTKAWFPSAANTSWFWPEDTIIRTGTQTMIGIWAKIRCANNAAYGSCGTELCVNGQPSGGACAQGSAICANCGGEPNVPRVAAANYPQVCRTVVNSGDVSTWSSPTCYDIKRSNGESPSAIDLNWGKSINYDGSFYYIYGNYTPSNNPYVMQAVLARATGQSITNYTQWEFLYTTGWQVGPPTQASQLKVVANHTNRHFNVEKVTLDGKPRWVMVHGGPTAASTADMVMVRIGKMSGSTPLMEWHDPPMTAPFLSDQNTWVGNIGEAYGIDPPCGNAAYAQFGQLGLSDEGKLKLSYYCMFVSHWEEPATGNVTPADVNGDQNPTAPGCDIVDYGNQQAYFRGYQWPAIYGRIRFYDLDLYKVKPWCTSNCWMP